MVYTMEFIGILGANAFCCSPKTRHLSSAFPIDNVLFQRDRQGITPLSKTTGEAQLTQESRNSPISGMRRPTASISIWGSKETSTRYFLCSSISPMLFSIYHLTFSPNDSRDALCSAVCAWDGAPCLYSRWPAKTLRGCWSFV